MWVLSLGPMGRYGPDEGNIPGFENVAYGLRVWVASDRDPVDLTLAHGTEKSRRDRLDTDGPRGLNDIFRTQSHAGTCLPLRAPLIGRSERRFGLWLKKIFSISSPQKRKRLASPGLTSCPFGVHRGKNRPVFQVLHQSTRRSLSGPSWTMCSPCWTWDKSHPSWKESGEVFHP